MRLSDTAYRVRKSFREIGPWQTLGHVSRQLYRRVVPQKVPVHPFDTEYGVETGGLIGGRLLATGHAHDRHGTAYWGTAPSLMRGSLARWMETLQGTGYGPPDYTLIDIGSGKGRVLMIASELPFRRIVGIELNAELTAVAQRNLARWKQTPHACNEIEAIVADALAVPLPETPVVLYLFNPFDAELMQLLLNRLVELSHGRSTPIDVLYTRPEHAGLFAAIPSMEVLWEGEIPFTAEDTAADVFHTTQQECFLYRLHPGMEGAR